MLSLDMIEKKYLKEIQKNNIRITELTTSEKEYFKALYDKYPNKIVARNINLNESLCNFKFSRAESFLDNDEPEDVKELVIALGKTFGNIYLEGNMRTIIYNALENIGAVFDVKN